MIDWLIDWMNEWMNEWIYEWINEWMNEWNRDIYRMGVHLEDMWWTKGLRATLDHVVSQLFYFEYVTVEENITSCSLSKSAHSDLTITE